MRNVIVSIDGSSSSNAACMLGPESCAASCCPVDTRRYTVTVTRRHTRLPVRWGSENFFRPDDHVILLHITKDFRSLDLEPGAVGSGKGSWT